MKEKIIIYRSKRKAFLVILAGILLLGASLLLFYYAGDEVFGWIFIAAAALVLIYGMSSLNDRKPQIIITEKGLTELFSVKEEIEWDAIRSADDFFYRGNDYVRILVPEGYKPATLQPTWWRLNRLYASEGLKAIFIRVSGLEMNSKQLTTVIVNMVNAVPEARNDYLTDSVKGRY